MVKKHTIQLSAFITIALSLVSSYAFADSPIANPCDGILSIVDRPSKADSPCTVPSGVFDFEAGYQFQNLGDGQTSQNFPESEVRFGLPFSTELMAILPNYIVDNFAPYDGFAATELGAKHTIYYNSDWDTAIEGFVTLPSGSNSFGSDKAGGTLNGIISYNLTSSISFTTMEGISTQTLPTNSGGQRFSSFNPDLLLSWDINDNFETFAEVYGQTQTAPNQGPGYDVDAGILYAFTKNTEVDLEGAQRLSGDIGGYRNYVGAGFATLFG